MNATATVRGTLNADGTLLLEQSTGLPPGPVEVTVKAMPTAEESEETVWEFLDRIWAGSEGNGQTRRTREEIDAEMREMREQDAEHDRMVDRIYEESSHARNPDALPQEGRD